MTIATTSKVSLRIPSFYDPSKFRATPRDLEIFAKQLASFVPPDAFDAHAHFYDMRIFATGAAADSSERDTLVGRAQYLTAIGGWMGDKCPRDGLFFPMPARGLDVVAANRLILDETHEQPGSRCLLI